MTSTSQRRPAPFIWIALALLFLTGLLIPQHTLLGTVLALILQTGAYAGGVVLITFFTAPRPRWLVVGLWALLLFELYLAVTIVQGKLLIDHLRQLTP